MSDEGKKISLNYLDLLREIGTIGAGRAATALADLLNCRVEILLPETRVVPLESLGKLFGNPEEVFFVLDIGVEGDLGGRVFFLLPPNEAKILGSVLLGQEPENLNTEDPLFQSSLKEMVNILTGAYMNALSDMTGLTIMYSVPSLAVDMIAALLDFFFVHIAQYSDEAIFIKTNLQVRNINFNSIFLFFPDMQSLRKLVDILGVKE
jgi:chemotaxis protein CheC